jgi:methyltransferase-like protein/cyclopropane fatty-acyl-phospholipid synthase-like methyltransferase
MSTADIKLNPYDEVIFPSQPLAQSHPDRLAAVARLLGMDPPSPAQSRVLELGCATGGNIIPMADRLPGSQFVGVDYSRAQLQLAERSAAQLETRNLKLIHADIGHLGTSLGQFDYIICHGVFSWVSPELQGKILDLVRDSLTPQGVAYISYNTNPGWYLRGVLREVLEKLAPEGQLASARLAQGRRVLEFLKSAAERQDTAYARLLSQEIEGIFRHPEGYIYHEYFESENRPLYFYQFAALAAQHGLQFLGEANVATMFTASYGPLAEQKLGQLQLDLISTEQHFDVLRNRSFRQSLLCRNDVPLNRQVTTAPLAQLYLHGRVAPEAPDANPLAPGSAVFTGNSGIKVNVDAPPLKAALTILGDIWPRASSFEQLAGQVHSQLTVDNGPGLSAEARESLAQGLLHCVASGVLEINSLPDDFTTTISERPAASRLARFEAQMTSKATNRRHQLVNLDDSTRTVLSYVDGHRDRPALLRELVEAVNRGDMSILIDGLPATRGEAVMSILGLTLEQALQKLARNALLIR